MKAPRGQGQLQQAEEAIDRIINGNHAAEIGETKERSKYGEI